MQEAGSNFMVVEDDNSPNATFFWQIGKERSIIITTKYKCCHMHVFMVSRKPYIDKFR